MFPEDLSKDMTLCGIRETSTEENRARKRGNSTA
jgi:hypothetical protein